MTIEEIRMKAENGSVSFQRLLGDIYTKEVYRKDYAVELDKAEGVKWYGKAAEQGDVVAQNAMGYAYHMGDGAVQDYAEAVKWYEKAAVQGYEIAISNLGNIYYKGGFGVEKC